MALVGLITAIRDPPVPDNTVFSLFRTMVYLPGTPLRANACKLGVGLKIVYAI